MKLFNVLSVTAFGVLFAVGCSSTDTTSSTDGGTDTGTVATDTGTGTETSADDTGTAEETSTDAGDTCTPCISDKCGDKVSACFADTAADGCKSVYDCVSACGSDKDCANACVKDTPGGDKFTEVVTCVNDNCSAECGG
jgi:hypothetical protein